jgi:hypothetical protein
VQPQPWPGSSGHLAGRTWETVRDRCYGHAEGTVGEDEPSCSMAAMVKGQPEGEARPG